jgi:hypothetical protein
VSLDQTIEATVRRAVTEAVTVSRAEKIEAAARSLIDRPDFWKNAGTLPGEYDNLVDALAEDPGLPPHLLVKCVHHLSVGLWAGCKACWDGAARVYGKPPSPQR